ncbi:MAG: glycerol kinase GlpK [Lachnospiraceae bacterium]|nr:glycerol kinase GlpK [Lachnospiraceae bacterium]
MVENYIVSIDQSTQGTKALLFNLEGKLINRRDILHKQIINDKGWVSHDPMEIYNNTVQVIKNLVEASKINKDNIIGLGISNQRETSLAWNRKTGKPLGDAIVWQCSRARDICEKVEKLGVADEIGEKTGLRLSPYFPAAKIGWLLENISGAKELSEKGNICHGTIDTWLVYKLTNGTSYKTDYSNASRTQLFNIFDLKWDEDICEYFGINIKNLPEVCYSDSIFGETDLEGFFNKPIPIAGVIGDSHGALFGQGCIEKGMIKATYGTGSSIMMNIGDKPILSTHGVVTSLAWGINGKINYVLEGNINYTGAVITWLKNEVELISNPSQTAKLCYKAKTDDDLYLIPAFTGLGAPYWDSYAKGALIGITRTTGKAEIVRAGVECIAYQINDIVEAMSEDAGIPFKELRVDGGPTRNKYLMQFQSDILGKEVKVPGAEELSGIGAAYVAGFSLKVFDETIFANMKRKNYIPEMDRKTANKKIAGWKDAVRSVLSKK